MLKTLNHYNKNNDNKGKQQKKCMLKLQQQTHRIIAKEPVSEEKQKRLTKQQGVFNFVALPLTLKSILRQKKNYGNSNILPCKDTSFKKSSKRNQNPSRYYNSITT
jgi:hypothetical protein